MNVDARNIVTTDLNNYSNYNNIKISNKLT